MESLGRAGAEGRREGGGFEDLSSSLELLHTRGRWIEISRITETLRERQGAAQRRRRQGATLKIHRNRCLFVGASLKLFGHLSIVFLL